MDQRTIAALCSPKGDGAISVIRISGDNAINIADKCFKSVSGKSLTDLKGYRAAFGTAVNTDGSNIDEAVALVFRAPKSYTGEDVVEISVHGGAVSAREVLNALFSAGAVSPDPGEFTKRAFLNGKINLAEAESVMEIIGANSKSALDIARGAKEGKISRNIETVTEKLLYTASALSAYSDFPDEDIKGLDYESFSLNIDDCLKRLNKLISTFYGGQAVLSGVPTAIVGKPNVGKSTLMNMLSGEDRSIVTPKAGTTRDVIEARVTAGDVTLLLSDTAGIHTAEDEIENIGVDRAIKKLNNSSLILAVFDLSAPFDSEDKRIIELIKSKRCIAVLNKADIRKSFDLSLFEGIKTVAVSAKENIGAEHLISEIEHICQADLLNYEDAVLLNERHYSCAIRARDALDEAKTALSSGVTLDAVTVLIDDAVNALLELSGKRASNEVVNEIFKNFCIGK